jgi:5-methylcytosine-specific restriction protein A
MRAFLFVVSIMPVAAKRRCLHPGCRVLVSPSEGGRCAEHRRVVERVHDDRRGSSSERGYNHRWQKARATYLRSHPLCVMCQAQGRLTPATVVDHIIPHRGDQTLFWATDTNWQSLCATCHSKHKQAIEAADRAAGGSGLARLGAGVWCQGEGG